jgi:hypothetical protein
LSTLPFSLSFIRDFFLYYFPSVSLLFSCSLSASFFFITPFLSIFSLSFLYPFDPFFLPLLFPSLRKICYHLSSEMWRHVVR